MIGICVVSKLVFIYVQDALSPLDVSAKGHVDRAIAVRLFSRVRPPGMNTFFLLGYLAVSCF